MARGRLEGAKLALEAGQLCQWGKGKCFPPPTSVSPKTRCEKNNFQGGYIGYGKVLR